MNNRYRYGYRSQANGNSETLDPIATAYINSVISDGGVVNELLCRNIFNILTLNVGLANIHRVCVLEATGYKKIGSNVDKVYYIKQGGSLGILFYVSGTKLQYTTGQVESNFDSVYDFSDSVTEATELNVIVKVGGGVSANAGASLFCKPSNFTPHSFMYYVGGAFYAINVWGDGTDGPFGLSDKVTSRQYLTGDKEMVTIANGSLVTPIGANNGNVALSGDFTRAFFNYDGMNIKLKSFALAGQLTTDEFNALNALIV